MRENERTDERVTQYSNLYSWLIWPTGQCESEGGSLANTQNGDAYNFVRQHIESSPDEANVDFIFGRVSPFTDWENGWFVGAQKNGAWRWFNGNFFFFFVATYNSLCRSVARSVGLSHMAFFGVIELFEGRKVQI